MANTDPIADMLTRIRNAAAVRKVNVSLPHSKMKETLAHVLKQANFIDDVKVEKEGAMTTLLLVLNSVDSNSRISTIDRMSTPGRRMYVNATEIPKVRQGKGIVIVSTSHGVMTGEQAKAKNLGGELICKVS
jgi:small subunit ribosomal protein S8